jgi:hypothetical protein
MMPSAHCVLALLLVTASPALANKTRRRAPPPAAQEMIDRTREAIDKHDWQALERVMAARFRDGAELVAARQAIAAWRAQPDELDGLQGYLLDCNAEQPDVVFCPERHGILEGDFRQPELRFERRDGRWRWTVWRR